MSRRYVTIWFRHLKTDWFIIRKPTLKNIPFVLAAPDHGRMIINESNSIAREHGIEQGMLVADARAVVANLEVLDDRAELAGKLLNRIAEWTIRYTPFVSIDPPDGLILDVTGCAHLWGGEKEYLRNIINKFNSLGYSIRVSIADTIGAAWANSRFGTVNPIIDPRGQTNALLSLPAAALRIEEETVNRLKKLGLRQVKDFINMPKSALRRRFGQLIIQRIDQAVGKEEETVHSIQPILAYQERLNCLEPIVTAIGIEIALKTLLEKICSRLEKEQKGLRIAIFKGYRVDGKIVMIDIGTNHPSHHVNHLYKLFEFKIATIEPALGIEEFTLDATKVEDANSVQEKLWDDGCGLDDTALAELLDRMGGKIGANNIHRYIPDEHYWPERSLKLATSLKDKAISDWRIDQPRPVQLLTTPATIEVMAPIPDYPPMNFRYKGKLHKIMKADGPERIEQEWWLQQGQHRDYYRVEDEEGKRYWLFRLGHYSAAKNYQWFIHGFFA